MAVLPLLVPTVEEEYQGKMDYSAKLQFDFVTGFDIIRCHLNSRVYSL
jgi:hypothetical protein